MLKFIIRLSTPDDAKAKERFFDGNFNFTANRIQTVFLREWFCHPPRRGMSRLIMWKSVYIVNKLDVGTAFGRIRQGEAKQTKRQLACVSRKTCAYPFISSYYWSLDVKNRFFPGSPVTVLLTLLDWTHEKVLEFVVKLMIILPLAILFFPVFMFFISFIYFLSLKCYSELEYECHLSPLRYIPVSHTGNCHVNK